MPARIYDSIESMGDDHYDVGIIGVWYGENYGSTLTYHALQKSIRNMGLSTIMLEKPAPRNDSELNWNIHSRVFAKQHYEAIAPHLALQDLPLLNAHCDGYVVGSDQVWNYGISKGFGKSFYLDFADEKSRKVSYGTSFGHRTSFAPMDALSDVVRLISRFDRVGVREDSAINVLHDEYGIEGMQVLDPVFLLDEGEYEDLMEPKVNTGDKYLLAYVLDPSPEVGASLKRLAEKRGLRLVVLADARGNKRAGNDVEASRQKLGIDDVEVCPDAPTWLQYIRNADFVVTDSFHGTCFSLMFHKQFFSLTSRSRGVERVKSLANVFHLWDNIATDPYKLEVLVETDHTIDYGLVDEILSHERARSRAWLKEALTHELVRPKDVSCVAKKECCGCGACYNACPFDAIRMVADAEGFLYPQVDDDTCRSCGMCKRACPSLNPRYENWKIPAMFAGYTTDSVRDISSSGGIFSLVAEHVLGKGGVVCGAAFDASFNLRQVVVESSDDLGPLRMSKYMQSDSRLTFRSVKEALVAGRPALYVGTPCQVAGLNTYLGKEYPELITIDLLCHGGPSQKVFHKYLDEVHRGRSIEHVGFRDKDHYGWSTEMTVRYADGETYREVRKKDLYYRSFLPCWSVRPHCQVCNYARLPRQGDLTLGDFWGVARYNPGYTDGKGTSIISVNSRKGLEVIYELEPSLDLLGGINLQYVLEHGQPLARPFANKPIRNRFQHLVQDTTLRKAVECCEQNVFDVGILGIKAITPFEPLGTYALYKTLTRNDRSALSVRYPLDAMDFAEPWRYRLVQFARRHYARVSDHQLLEALPNLNDLCCSYVSTTRLPRGVTEFARAKSDVCCLSSYTKLPAVLLLDGDDYRALAAGAHDPVEGAFDYGIALLHGSEHEPAVRAYVEGTGASVVDLCEDREIEALVGAADNCRLVLTDDADCFALCAALGRRALLLPADGGFALDAAKLGMGAFALARGEEPEAAIRRVEQLAEPRWVRSLAMEDAVTVLLADVAKLRAKNLPLIKEGRAQRAPQRRGSEGRDAEPQDGATDVMGKTLGYLRKNGLAATFKRIAQRIR